MTAIKKNKPSLSNNQSASRKYPPTITTDEATQMCKEISNSYKKVFKYVVFLQKTRGCGELGYRKLSHALKECCPELSNSVISQLIKAAERYLFLEPEMDNLHKVTESTFRPTYGLSDDNVQQVWKYVLENIDPDKEKRITQEHVTNAITALKIETKKQNPRESYRIVNPQNKLFPIS